MNDNSLKVFRISLIASIMAFALLLGNCQATKYNIRVAIESGTPPMAAKCALAADTPYDCTFLFAKEGR